MLDCITPVILTYNEEANLGRTLSKLRWARRVIVVDSGSADATIQIASAFSNVEVFVRKFDTHARQWAYAVGETNIWTDWVLRLDADYEVTDALIESMARLQPVDDVDGFLVKFSYAIHGLRLLSSLYPSNVVLFRRGRQTIVQDGHTERWIFRGATPYIAGTIVHDDRKSVESWGQSQIRYMRSEVAAVHASGTGFVPALRRCPPGAPIAVFLYTLFVKGAILSGRAGMLYALQRLVAEAILSLMYLDDILRARSNGRSGTGE